MVLSINPGATGVGTATAAGQAINVTQQSTLCVTSLVPNALTFDYPGFDGNPSGGQSKPVTIFRWLPGAEVAGTFEFVFVQRGCDRIERRIPIAVRIE